MAANVRILAFFVIIAFGTHEAFGQSVQVTPPRVTKAKTSGPSPAANKATSPGLKPRCRLVITEPTNGSTVALLGHVGGIISPAMPEIDNGNVWVVIHPEWGPHYVQPVGVVVDGHFTSSVYFGDRGTRPGHRFIVRAFVDPKQQLSEGQELRSFPASAACKSDPIQVLRD